MTLAVLGFIVAGLVLAALVAPALNALALGDESGRSLGVHVARTRVLVVVAITLLAGAATAAVGPLMFLGLVVPFVARAICGPDQRWITPTCILAAPVVALVADVAARTVVAPQEVQLGIMTALLGGPVFIAVVRRRRIEAL
ncbi:iron chelate uptake ABC transporter family permease subunit [Corynebacterium bovis]|uniref:iron chelate uptake ABC transporter family permease subunit n=1 Tax=Corynebacterium bovis TaxID=36808 RepID=UPI0021AB4066|nr:iron chelate uptake ABC transporter family permease subunit [Corynebacterium bovis]MDN8580300.1 iron chelate uptake ABC transporter family permease subunit [Corynebacterium bovis]